MKHNELHHRDKLISFCGCNLKSIGNILSIQHIVIDFIQDNHLLSLMAIITERLLSIIIVYYERL
ncbi:protein of unknown function [Xenorhabdus doucetiae]|uniref:Uncharacterized protein n=1 Tax=Xenorhabdus doucetiae TaxID=351671 RepID=A0A068QQI0_9GAMM|nr:protein of unknown function [Xenorhabdus doucetiae]